MSAPPRPRELNYIKSKWLSKAAIFIVCFLCIEIVNNRGITFASSKSAEKELNYFDVLDLPKTATTQQIKKQYRELSKKYHPDRNKSEDAHVKFTQVAQAYEVLSDEQERRDYIQLGHETYTLTKARGQSGNRGDQFWDFPFSFFGGGQRQRGKEKAPAMNFRLYVTLEQIYFGDLLHASFRRSVLCPHVDECTIDRPDCVGPGVKVVNQQVGPGFVVQNQIHDESCVAQRKGIKRTCSQCPDGLTIMEKTILSVLIEAGTKNGHKIVFEDAGIQKMGHDSGDLVLQVVVQPHTQFVRDVNNINLHTVMPVTLIESLAGFEKEIKHINGTSVTISHTAVTADYDTVVVKKQGLPTFENENLLGDLIVTMRVKYPVSLTRTQREACSAALKDVRDWRYVSDPLKK